MASDLTVQTIRGPGSGANANQILIPSGHKVIAPAGGLVAPGQVVSFQQNIGGSGSVSSTSAVEVNSGIRVSVTPKSTSNKFVITIQIGIRFGNTGARYGLYIYKSTDGGSTFSLLHGYPEISSNSTTDQQDFITLTAYDSPNTTAAVVYTAYHHTAAGGALSMDLGNNNSAQSNGGARLTVMEIAG